MAAAVAALGVGAVVTARAGAQAAIDPNVAPRAAQLERQGERHVAVDLLGRYLAVAPDDGRAWFQLGRFYLFDARDWHTTGHRGDPDGPLYLDFAVTAFDQSVRLRVDSAVVFRNIAEMERALVFVEDSGWEAARQRRPRTETPAPPAYVTELGVNLLNSCPMNGVLLTGSELESMSVWYVSLERRVRADVVPIRPELYATDSLYRRAMARSLGVDSGLPVQRALAVVAVRRPICLTPSADSAAAPALAWVPFRLARVSRMGDVGEALSVLEVVRASRTDASPWVREIRSVYDQAAARNAVLCGPLVLLFGDAPPPACRQ